MLGWGGGGVEGREEIRNQKEGARKGRIEIMEHYCGKGEGERNEKDRKERAGRRRTEIMGCFCD